MSVTRGSQLIGRLERYFFTIAWRINDIAEVPQPTKISFVEGSIDEIPLAQAKERALVELA
jgi:hypothetical protein